MWHYQSAGTEKEYLQTASGSMNKQELRYKYYCSVPVIMQKYLPLH